MSGSHTVVAGDTVSEIAAKYGLRTEDVLRWNSMKADDVIHPGQQIELSGHEAPVDGGDNGAGVGDQEYVVQAGDTLSQIAQKFKVGWKGIAVANGIEDPDKIRAGQTLTIPANPA